MSQPLHSGEVHASCSWCSPLHADRGVSNSACPCACHEEIEREAELAGEREGDDFQP